MSFDTLAPYYGAMEWVSAGGILQRCRTWFLDEAAGCRRALLLGEGPGRFLAELLNARPELEVTCVERSGRMIEEARHRARRRGLDVARVRFEPRDALTWRPPRAAFDLVATHFFLDCFRPGELAVLIPRLAAAATGGARWLIADFRVPPAGWRRWRARALLTVMYAFFRWATGLSAVRLTPPDGFLESAGFRLAGRRLANCGLVHSDLWLKEDR